MKKRHFFQISILFLSLILGHFTDVLALPPSPPSVFYGEIHFMPDDGEPIPGDYVYAYVPDIETPVAETQITTNGTNLSYSIKVPADDVSTVEVKEGGNLGDEVTFKIAGRIVAKGTWNSTITQNIVFHPPKVDAGGPYETVIDKLITLFDTYADWKMDDSFTFDWDLFDNDGVFECEGHNPQISYSIPGIKEIILRVTDAQGGEGIAATTITVKENASIILSNLSQTYDGTPKTVNVTTVPEGLPVNVTYNGSDNAPIEAGSYEVIATVVDDIYQGSTYDTLVISPAPVEITLSNLDQDYDGYPKPVSITMVPTGLAYTVTYDGLTDPPSATGAYPVVVTINEKNYQGSASDTLVIRETQNITLVPGWNLVSLNLHPYPSLASSAVLNSIEGNYDLVYAWDGTGAHSTSGHWLSYDNVEMSPDTLTEINELFGIWVHSTAIENQTLSVKGFIPVQTSIELSTAANGWNLVSFPSSAPMAPEDAFIGIASHIGLVFEYEASNSSQPWKVYDPGAPDYVNDIDLLTPNYGYWMFVDANVTWNLSY